MGWFATHADVIRARDEVAELGSLVDPSDRARAVTAGCFLRVFASVVALIGFGFSVSLGFLAAEYAHWAAGLLVGIGGAVLSLLGSVSLTNTAMAALYRRAARRAVSTPVLTAVSSGSSAAVPSLKPKGDEPL